MTPDPSREPSALPRFPILAAAVLATACTAPNPDFRPLGLVVADTTAKQSADMVFDVRIDAQDVAVTLDYEAVDDTAVKGREYLETKGTLTLEPGTTTASIVVPTLLYNHVPSDVNLKLNVTVTRRTLTDTQSGTGTITPIAELAPFTSIASGPYHACGVTPQKTVRCWGGGFGRSPEAVVGLTSIATISAGGGHTCAVTAGAVKCWGENYSGALGNNSTTSSKVPVDVLSLSGVTAVAAGGSHTCALTTDGWVKCWGDNSGGQLGNNSTISSPVPVEISTLRGVPTVTAVAAGGAHTCAVTGEGHVKCWGSNSEGQLGNGATTSSPVPVDVKDRNGNNLTGVTSIDAGSEHTCALTARGSVYCWGANREGQLGNNSTERSLVATMEVPNVSGATAVTAGSDHTCAIVAQGAVKCWGRGGSVGNNSTARALTPVDVVGLTGITAITAGFGNTLALTAQGTVKGWGGNALGGNVTTNTEVPIDVAGFTEVTAIARPAPGIFLDERNDTCSVTAQKTVRCTTREDWLKGVDVAGLTDVATIAVGAGYTCAATAQGNVQCLGRNSKGQLGNNSTSDSELPVDVVGLSNVTSIAAGGTHTCALTADGRVKCWGDNSSGTLGNNSTTASLVPVDTGLSGVASIAAGIDRTYAVTKDGSVKRWGVKARFGPSGPIIDAKPVDFSELAGITSVALGYDHACALTSQGTVKCWGSNYNGELGNNSTIASEVPVNVTGLSGVTSISAGWGHTCAVTSQGTAMCWGVGGAYGADSSSATTAPIEALGGQKVLGIIAGDYLTLFLTQHHTVRQVGRLQNNTKVPVDTVYQLK